MDTASMELIGELSIPVGRFPMETVQRRTSSQTNTWTPLMHSATMQRQHSTMDSASQKLTGVI